MKFHCTLAGLDGNVLCVSMDYEQGPAIGFDHAMIMDFPDG